MKQGTVVTRAVMIVLFVGLLLYFGIYALRSLRDPFTTTYAYSYTVDDGVEASGLLVREETVLPERSGIVSLTAGEGEKVGKGQTVAVIYGSAAAQDRAEQIRALELEIEQLEFALTGASGGSGSARLDEDIADSIIALRSSAVNSDLTDLEDQTGLIKRFHAMQKQLQEIEQAAGEILERSHRYDDPQLEALAVKIQDIAKLMEKE